MILLRTDQLTKDFGGLRAVDKVSFVMPEGIILGLIGPNGSGKTTLFNLITGFLQISGGQVYFRDKPIGGLPAHKIAEMGISRTFQLVRVFQRLTVMENMLLGYKNHVGESPWMNIYHSRKYRSQDKEAVTKAFDLLDLVGLKHLANHRAEKLPYAQQKMIEITRTIMGDPELIMLDGPASGINPTLVSQLLDYIRFLKEKQNKSFIIVEHDMHVIMNICDYIIVLNHGAKIAEGTPEQSLHNPDVIDAYLGGS
jgi:ABC-type branched-subunit amino acid transport system ATPase component